MLLIWSWIFSILARKHR